MKYYSTRHLAPDVDLRTAVTKGLAPDRGLYMPEKIEQLEPYFFAQLAHRTFQESSFEVARSFFGGDIPSEALQEIVYDTLSFQTPLLEVEKDVYSLELFHGPTLAFKDVGARFMARMLAHFLAAAQQTVHVLVATSGDTGSAVANGFLGIEGIHVHVLYPKGKVSEIQEKQFTTLGQNITALEVDGTFDDCQALVKAAFLDEDLQSRRVLTSANSINVARFLPQAFYYFNAVAQLNPRGKKIVFAVPSGNFGNLTAGLIAARMGLPVERFIAANNRNDVVYQYLQTGHFEPKPSVPTIANAMDVGDPSNFVRILDLFDQDHAQICEAITGVTYPDEQIKESLAECYHQTGYLLDPHGAVAYRALKEQLRPDEVGIFLETAHPAKFTETVEAIVGPGNVPMPEKLHDFLKGEKQSLPIGTDFSQFKDYLLSLKE
ncbi:MAG: threonine synthase [Marinilabiliales bacterium]|nr:threonine synthase [Marinilabiliales bacterium]